MVFLSFINSYGMLVVPMVTFGIAHGMAIPSIQGLLVGQMADGKIMVKVDEKTFVGYPVTPVRNA